MGNGIVVQVRQRGVHVVGLFALTMDILCIDETAADTRRYINQVEFHDTCDWAPNFLIESGTCTFLRGDFQIYA